MRPRLLGVFSWCMAACAGAGLLFWQHGMPAGVNTLFWLTPAVSAVVIWRFWRGSNWARWLVMLAAILVAVPNGILSAWAPAPLFGRAFPGWRALFIAEAVLGAALLVWLNTRSVRAFFRTKHEVATNAG